MIKSFVLFLVFALLLGCNPTRSSDGESPVIVSPSSPEFSSHGGASSSSVESLTECIGYDRDLYKHWVDQDADCQDTRQEVLNDENLLSLSNDCKIALGEWYDPYSDSIFADPSDLDIDHLVPLAEAHRSGAYRWTNEQREAFANDLESSESLIAVWNSQNRSKSDRDPSEWLPMSESFHKEYVLKWVSVKVKWGLTSDNDEMRVIREIVGDDSLAVGFEFPVEAAEVYCDVGSSSVEWSSSSSMGEYGECGSKTTCGEMTSCEEAIFFLEQCGVSRLDGDGDGTPCESVCS